MARKSKKSPSQFTLIHPNAAGIDIGASSHFIAIPAGRCDQPIQEFQCFTSDLHRSAQWLKAHGITTVAMESTGIYWLPLYEILEAEGLEVKLVNARQVKNLPGRKTDVLDCQWIQHLHSYGLLEGAFQPDKAIAPLRAYTRHRGNWVRYAGQHIQHMQKALRLMNLNLDAVVKDITGATGTKLIQAMLAGERDPQVLAQMRDPRCKKSQEEIAQALTAITGKNTCLRCNKPLTATISTSGKWLLATKNWRPVWISSIKKRRTDDAPMNWKKDPTPAATNRLLACNANCIA